MFVYLDDQQQLGIDCVAALSARRSLVMGWVMAPRGQASEITVTEGADTPAALTYCGFHPRPDVRPADPRRAAVQGFSLLVETEAEPDRLNLTLHIGTAVLRADLRDPNLETNLFKAMADRDWHASFDLLRDAASNPALAPLLGHRQRPLGAFADWLPRLPLLRSKAEGLGALAEVEALTTGAGEVLVLLRGSAPMPADAVLDVALIGTAGGAPVLLPLLEWHMTSLPGALAGYGRIDPAWLDRLSGIEAVVQAEFRPAEPVWLRATLRQASPPDFLDAICRSAPMAHSAAESGLAQAIGWLRQVIAWREASFAPLLATLAGTAAPLAETMPRIGLILGADDPAAIRLFHVTAAAFEARCTALLVLGDAAEPVAQIFARRGRLPVTTGAAALLALREASGRAGILAVEVARFAEAVAAGRMEDAFSAPLGAADLARLLALHAVAGCAPALSDSLSRLLRLRRATSGEPAFAPPMRAWSNPYAAELVNAHLAGLWTAHG